MWYGDLPVGDEGKKEEEGKNDQGGRAGVYLIDGQVGRLGMMMC